MMPDLDAKLTAGEFQSLREVSKGAMQGIIPAPHKAKLINLGYIKEGLGGLMVTDIGSLRIAKAVKRFIPSRLNQGSTMSGSSAGFKRQGAACENCSEPFSLFLAVKDFRSVEKLPDPFRAKCPACGHEADYPKSAIRIFASVG